MKRLRILLAIVSVILVCLPFSAIAQGEAGKIVLGYYTVYYSGDKASYDSLTANGSYLNQISTKTYTLDAEGNVSGTTPADAISYAKSNQIGTYAAVTNEYNGVFDPNVAHAVLSDASLRQKLIDNLLTMAVSNGFSGVNIDFENMFAADRAVFSQFMKDVTAKFHANNLKTIVSVTAKTSDCSACSWSGAFDYAALGLNADYVQIMTYDQHGSWGSPGPVAGADWVENVLKYATGLIVPGKIMIGLPAYGYDWNVTTNSGNKAVAWKNIPSLLASTNAEPQWDAASQSPYFTYTAADGSKHTVWYENTESIAAKSALVNKYGLAGVSVWCLRLEDASFWKAVHQGLGSGTTTPAPEPVSADSVTTVTTSKTTYYAKETVYVTVLAADTNKKAIPSASVKMTLTDPAGKITTYTGTTDATGKKVFTLYTSKKSMKGTYKVSVTTTHSQYKASTGATSYILK